MNDPDHDYRSRGADAAARPDRRRARWPLLILVLLLIAGLVIGLAAWLAPATRARLVGMVVPAPTDAPAGAAGIGTPDELRDRIAALEAALARQPDAAPDRQPDAPLPPINSPDAMFQANAGQPLEARIAALEAQTAALRAAEAASAIRLDQLANGLAAASGAAADSNRQMMDLLLLAVARRHVEQGRPFGRLADVIATRFRGTDAAAVDAMVAWGAAPQTRGLLAARLDALSLKVGAEAPVATGTGFWSRLRAQLSSLVTVRERDAASAPDPVALAAARDALDSGDIALAAARVEQLPPGPGRDAWLADAALLLTAERALDRLETQLLADIAAREAASLPASAPAG